MRYIRRFFHSQWCIFSLFFILTCLYLFPIFQGLIILPLDLLVSNYQPWGLSGEILLKNPYVQDAILQIYPWKMLAIHSLAAKIIPFWNPYQFLGMPLLASMKSMVFYPLHIVFLFGDVIGWNTFLFLQIFLSLIFMYLFVRDLGIGKLASIVSSLSFAFCSMMIGLLEYASEGHVLLWIPLLLFCVKRFFDTKKGVYLFLLGVSLACSIFGGQLQYSAYIYIILFSFIFYYGCIKKVSVQSWLYIFLSVILGSGITLVQIIPSLEIFSFSFRQTATTNGIFLEGLLPVFQLFRLFSPDFFGNPVTHNATIGYIEGSGYFGVISLFFALYSLFFIKKNRFVQFFFLLFLGGALFCLRGIGNILYYLHIPIITTGQANRMFLIALFSGSVLAGLGFDTFCRDLLKNKIKQVLLLILFMIIFVSGVFVTKFINHIGLMEIIKNIQFNAEIFVGFSICYLLLIFLPKILPMQKIILLVIILALVYLDFFRFGYRFLTFSNPKFLYPSTTVTTFIQQATQNTLSREYGLTEPEIDTYFHTYSVETYNSLYSQKTAKLLEALQGKNNSDFSENRYVLSSYGSQKKYALDFLGVKYIIVGKDVNPAISLFHDSTLQNDFNSVYTDDSHNVYENKNAYPRFGLYYQAKTNVSDKNALALLTHRTLDFRKIVLLRENLSQKLQQGTGSATLLHSTINTQRFLTYTTTPAIFYISDTNYPGWQATINGKKAPILTANYALKALLIPKGTSTIELEYVPSNFLPSVIASVVSFLLLIFLSFFYKRVNVSL